MYKSMDCWVPPPKLVLKGYLKDIDMTEIPKIRNHY